VEHDYSAEKYRAALLSVASELKTKIKAGKVANANHPAVQSFLQAAAPSGTGTQAYTVQSGYAAPEADKAGFGFSGLDIVRGILNQLQKDSDEEATQIQQSEAKAEAQWAADKEAYYGEKAANDQKLTALQLLKEQAKQAADDLGADAELAARAAELQGKYLAKLELTCDSATRFFEYKTRSRNTEIETLQAAINVLESADLEIAIPAETRDAATQDFYTETSLGATLLGVQGHHKNAAAKKQDISAFNAVMQELHVPTQTEKATWKNQWSKIQKNAASQSSLLEETLNRFAAAPIAKEGIALLTEKINTWIDKISADDAADLQLYTACKGEVATADMFMKNKLHAKEMATIKAQFDADQQTTNSGASVKVSADLVDLKTQINELNTVRTNDKDAFSENLRKEELTLRALKKAIQILRHFYGGAPKGATLLQTGQEPQKVSKVITGQMAANITNRLQGSEGALLAGKTVIENLEIGANQCEGSIDVLNKNEKAAIANHAQMLVYLEKRYALKQKQYDEITIFLSTLEDAVVKSTAAKVAATGEADNAVLIHAAYDEKCTPITQSYGSNHEDRTRFQQELLRLKELLLGWGQAATTVTKQGLPQLSLLQHSKEGFLSQQPQESSWFQKLSHLLA